MNDLAPIGHNGPPHPVEAVIAPYHDTIAETDNWLDGTPVETEAQMQAVDALLRGVKDAEKAVEQARKAATAPLNAAWKAEIAAWKPTEDDLAMRRTGLLALVDTFKRKLAAEKAEAERKAWREAEDARRAAEAAAAQANAGNIEDMRAAADAKRQAEDAQAALSAAQKDTVKGLRVKHETTVIDMTAWARLAWKDHRDECDAFFADLARRYRPHVPGVVETTRERVAV